MKRLNLIMYVGMVFMLSACRGALENDDSIHVCGQYVVETADGYVPFEHRVKCDMTVTYYSQVSYGLSTYEKQIPFYSEYDGSFNFRIDNVGSYQARMCSRFWSGDTLVYYQDTLVVCRKGNPVGNVMIPMQKSHVFAPTIVPKRFAHNDTITFSINHDALTHIELGRFSVTEEVLLWDSIVDNVQAVSFPVPLVLQDRRSFNVRYTTLHYGTYTTALFYID